MDSLQTIIKPHEDYATWLSTLAMYEHLYSGGAVFKANATKYLYRRHREPNEIYQERLSRAFYENHIGSIIDWYASTLFHREPIITAESPFESVRKYFYSFVHNCDGKNTSLTNFMRSRMIETLVYGKAYIQLEFPTSSYKAKSRSEEVQLGLDCGYMVSHHPLDVINWSHDEKGNLNLIVIRNHGEDNANSRSRKAQTETFLVYTPEEYLKVEKAIGSEEDARVLYRGTHPGSAEGIVPFVSIGLSEGMWLMNKSAHLQLEHFNKTNSLAWSLGMALYATPVIYSKREWKSTIGESYYIHLDPEDKFGWTEPEGNVYRIAMENLHRLQEELYRTCYLTGQSRGWLNGSQSMSAESKKADNYITQEVLRGLGDTAKDAMKHVLSLLARIRREQVVLAISGLDAFDVGDLEAEVIEVEKLLSLNIKSKTLVKQLHKKLALRFVADANETTKQAIAQEIEESE